MAQSPLEARSRDEIGGYLENWDALSSMITRGRPFSGEERHCAFLNLGSDEDGAIARFADVSAASGLDLIDDGRAVAVADWDQDGDLDFWLTNRTAPRLRLLRNTLAKSGQAAWVAFAVEGTDSNRDGIGAILELQMGGRKHTRSLHAGAGFMSQGSKRVHFGIGDPGAEPSGTLAVRWPGGGRELFEGIAPGRAYRIVQGSGSAQPMPSAGADAELPESPLTSPETTERARIILSHRVDAPAIDYVDFDGQLQRYQPDAAGSAPILINLWASWCAPCVAELAEFKQRFAEFEARGLRILALSTEAVTEDGSRPNIDAAKELVADSQYPFAVGVTDANGLRWLSVLNHSLFSRERPLPLPSSFLIDRYGRLAAIYRGPVSAEQLLSDLDLLGADRDVVFEAAFPFPGRNGFELFRIGELDFARAYQAGGYIDDARRHARLAINATKANPAMHAQSWYYLATLEQGARNWEAAAEAYRQAIKHAPSQPLLRIPLGVVLWQAGNHDAANRAFAEAEAGNPRHPKLLDALGKAHLQIGRPGDAVRFLETLAEFDPENTAHALILAVAHERNGDGGKALAIYRDILERHPDAPDAKNNLAWLLATSPDDSLRDGAAALKLATELNEAAGIESPASLDTLAAAQAETGDFDAAVASIDKAIGIARRVGAGALVKKLREKRQSYRLRKPFRSSPGAH